MGRDIMFVDAFCPNSDLSQYHVRYDAMFHLKVCHLYPLICSKRFSKMVYNIFESISIQLLNQFIIQLFPYRHLIK